ncbi:hypothetical protein [Psittacicella hinzii]|uniref:Uncharacterized protein n=1 Tax=Psittacicella hinzii TaxID=2028575 RepID=A0A3A1YC00_9GAMM|nr:hypothetical protein [Psittacicella hinzii]RIY34906.1 hypothetical protein CKF58_07465 [Psittacicella hinzii]
MERPVSFFYQLLNKPGVTLLLNLEQEHNILVEQGINSFVSYTQYKCGLIHSRKNYYFSNRWWNRYINSYTNNEPQLKLGFNTEDNIDTSSLNLKEIAFTQVKHQDIDKQLAYDNVMRGLEVKSQDQAKDKMRRRQIAQDVNDFSLVYWSLNYTSFYQQYLATNSSYMLDLMHTGEPSNSVTKLKNRIQKYNLLDAPNRLKAYAQNVHNYYYGFLNPLDLSYALNTKLHQAIDELDYLDLLDKPYLEYVKLLLESAQNTIVIDGERYDLDDIDLIRQIDPDFFENIKDSHDDDQEIIERDIECFISQTTNLIRLYRCLEELKAQQSFTKFARCNKADLTTQAVQQLNSFDINLGQLPEYIIVPQAWLNEKAQTQAEYFTVNKFTHSLLKPQKYYTLETLQLVGSRALLKAAQRKYPALNRLEITLIPDAQGVHQIKFLQPYFGPRNYDKPEVYLRPWQNRKFEKGILENYHDLLVDLYSDIDEQELAEVSTVEQAHRVFSKYAQMMTMKRNLDQMTYTSDLKLLNAEPQLSYKQALALAEVLVDHYLPHSTLLDSLQEFFADYNYYGSDLDYNLASNNTLKHEIIVDPENPSLKPVNFDFSRYENNLEELISEAKQSVAKAKQANATEKVVKNNQQFVAQEISTADLNTKQSTNAHSNTIAPEFFAQQKVHKGRVQTTGFADFDFAAYHQQLTDNNQANKKNTSFTTKQTQTAFTYDKNYPLSADLRRLYQFALNFPERKVPVSIANDYTVYKAVSSKQVKAYYQQLNPDLYPHFSRSLFKEVNTTLNLIKSPATTLVFPNNKIIISPYTYILSFAQWQQKYDMFAILNFHQFYYAQRTENNPVSLYELNNETLSYFVQEYKPDLAYKQEDMSLEALERFLDRNNASYEQNLANKARLIYIEDFITFAAQSLNDFSSFDFAFIRDYYFEIVAAHSVNEPAKALVELIGNQYSDLVLKFANAINDIYTRLEDLSQKYDVHFMINFNVSAFAKAFGLSTAEIWQKMSYHKLNFIKFSLDKQALVNRDTRTELNILDVAATDTYAYLNMLQNTAYQDLTSQLSQLWDNQSANLLFKAKASINIQLSSQDANLTEQLHISSSNLVADYYPASKNLNLYWE